MLVHHIQRKIIQQLLYSPSLGYAKLRPAGVESNHFAYHLDQLVKSGYLTKNGRDYSLTTQGLALADRVNHQKVEVRFQPHIVSSIYVQNDAGKLLLFKHAFQPYLGLYGPIQGRLHYDETIAEAAARELQEKTGLTDVALLHRGMAYIQALHEGETVSKLLAHIFTGTVTGEPGVTTADSKNGQPLWVDSSVLRSEERMPGFNDIEALLRTNPEALFFTEITTSLTAIKHT